MFALASLRDDRFSWKTALSLVLASKLSYERKAAVEKVATSTWGFDSCEFLSVGDTQAFIAQAPGVLMVAFRGTESVADWLANLNVISTQRPYGSVHSGFLGAFAAVQPVVGRALSGASGGSTKIWLTGHSLGGALATVAAAELHGTAGITGIYTYGQPRVGDTRFKASIGRHYGGRFLRFVNNEDFVTKIPPGYDHVGRLIHFDREGNAGEAAGVAAAAEPPSLTPEEFAAAQREIRAVRAALAEPGALEDATLDARVEGIIPGLTDHRIERYIAVIRSLAEPSRASVADIARSPPMLG